MKTLLPCLVFLACLLRPAAHGKVLDNFDDNTKTGWTDFTFLPNFGTPVESGGQFKFNLPPAGQSIFAASTKTSESFTLQEGRTIEFSVDLMESNGADSFAILSFIPKSSAISELAGYSMAISTTDFLIAKGINKYFYNENQGIKTTNVMLILSLTVKDGNVHINAKVLDKDNNNALLFEQSAVDTPAADALRNGTDSPMAPYLGEGNFALLCYEDNGTTQASYEVTFDNAETYVCDAVTIDDFNDNVKTAWTDFTFQPGFGAPVESNGQFKFNLPPAGQSIFAASIKTAPVFELKEGERLQFKVDLVSTNGHDAFAVMGFIPTSAQVSQLAGYTIAKSSTDILLTKGINKYFYNDDPPDPVKNENVTMVLTLTMKSGSVIIRGQILDKDNADAVIFDQTAVDTPAEDALVNGTDSPAVPYSGAGNFVLFCYEDAGTTQPSYEVTFDNAAACATPVTSNAAPVISQIQPEPFSNFLPAATQVSFKAGDDKALPDAQISITLNGTEFTTANGLVLSGPANDRTVSIGGLKANVNYTAILKVTDSDGVLRSATVPFDTFAQDSFVIEAEDFNFNGGSFWDNPAVIAEGTGPVLNAYAGQSGFNFIDYNETRTDFDDVPYRPTDPVRMGHSLDFPRAKFIAAGGTASGVYDYDVSDFVPEEWTNYTRTFPPGTYDVYLRQAVGNMPLYACALERVTGDRSQANQTSVPVGFFNAPLTGFRYGNTPLMDTAGATPVSVALSGVETLRIRQIDTIPNDALVLQNYLLFIRHPDEAVFVITSVTWDQAQRRITFTWPSVTGHNYKVEASPDLQTWSTLAAAHPSGGTTTSYSDTPPASPGRRYYRVTR
jgi:hypothetical protein